MGFHTIGINELWNMRHRKDVLIIDLRDSQEFRRFHLEGARNFPYDGMAGWKNMIPKNKKLIVYCERGSTSMLAAKKLSQMGYEVYTLVGGIQALNE